MSVPRWLRLALEGVVLCIEGKHKRNDKISGSWRALDPAAQTKMEGQINQTAWSGTPERCQELGYLSGNTVAFMWRMKKDILWVRQNWNSASQKDWKCIRKSGRAIQAEGTPWEQHCKVVEYVPCGRRHTRPHAPCKTWNHWAQTMPQRHGACLLGQTLDTVIQVGTWLWASPWPIPGYCKHLEREADRISLSLCLKVNINK